MAMSHPGVRELLSRWEGADPRRLPAMSDVVGLQRREAVEGHRGIGCRVRAGPFDQELVPDLQTERQHIRVLLVHHVGGVAGRAGQYAGAALVAVAWRADRVADLLVHGLGEAAE